MKLPSGIKQSLRLIRMFSYQKQLGGYAAWNLIDGRWWTATVFMPKAGRSQNAIYDYIEDQRKGTLLFLER